MRSILSTSVLLWLGLVLSHLACTPPSGVESPRHDQNVQGEPETGAPGQLSLTGRIIAVHDGDTITLLTDTHVRHKIRLAGIDAPELAQDFGRRAKENLSDLVYSKDVDVLYRKFDRNGRVLGKIVHAGEDINLRQIVDGYAWYFRAFERDIEIADRSAYAAAETRARELKRGLWSHNAHIPPWTHRKAKALR